MPLLSNDYIIIHAGQMNSYNNIMTLSVDATERSVTCTRAQGLSPEKTFRCDFCYATDGSCQDQADPGTGMMSCSSGLDGTGTRILSTLSEGTYCYRATAVVDGTPNVVVQDTFNIRQQGTVFVKVYRQLHAL